MRHLFQCIREAVADERYLIGKHAAQRLDERGIPEWQVLAGLDDAQLIQEHPDDQPNPSIEVEQWLPDGTPIKAVWCWLAYNKSAKLVTVHYFDR